MTDTDLSKNSYQASPKPSQSVRLVPTLSLVDWQAQAVQKWCEGDGKGPFRGTLEIFTGGGKTLIALAAFAHVSALQPSTRLAVVVPTIALARQWAANISKYATLDSSEIGILGAGHRDTFDTKRALVSVLNSASRKLPEMARSVGRLMLVVDECHRAGAAQFSRVLDTPAEYRLGLSATPARDDVDDDGLPVAYHEQVTGQKLGAVVFRFGLKEARKIGWLPEYSVHHHGIHLTDVERREYDQLSRKVSDAADRLSGKGIQFSQARQAISRRGEIGELAQAFVGAVSSRKDFLFRIGERGRVAAALVERALARAPNARILLFHERMQEADLLFRALVECLPKVSIALEHSDLPDAVRRKALERFQRGDVDVLVSVKSLVEGLDVPDADIGISVASTSSVRQRIQTLGRVLRRQFEPGAEKHAEMHVLYVSKTVDEAIYGKEDWSDLTGAEANQYWLWPLEPEAEPVRELGPPLTPKPTEEAEWQRLGEHAPVHPVPWLGMLPELEYSADTRGNVSTAAGSTIENPQGVAEMVGKVRKRPGGRFRVTHEYRLILVFGEGPDGMIPYVVGRVAEPFRTRTNSWVKGSVVNVSDLKPGENYPGPPSRARGIFKLRQKRGGVIERKQGATIEFAITEGPPSEGLVTNARSVLGAWRSLGTVGLTFYVNELWHAWFEENGQPRFLAAIPEGFRWPSADATHSKAEG